MGNTLIAGTYGRGMFKSDTNPPVIDRVIARRIDATHAAYTVYFNKNVTGLDSADFALVTTGSVAATITSVSGSGDTYTVNVAVTSGTGKLSLNTGATVTIVDLMGQALTTSFIGSNSCLITAGATPVYYNTLTFTPNIEVMNMGCG